MSEIFNSLKKEFQKKKIDITFSVGRLDELTSKEREVIEDAIVERCKQGDSSCFKFIPYLKTLDPIDLISDDEIEMFDSYSQAKIYEAFYERSKDSFYLNCINDLAIDNPRIFNLMIRMYTKSDSPKIKALLRKQILLTERYAADEYSDLYSNIIKNRGLDVNLESSISKKRLDIDKVKGGIIGFATGDALGVPVEFTSRDERKMNPVNDMRAYGAHYVPEGTWSDDTSMTIATMDSIREKGFIDYDDIMNKYCQWMTKAKYTATNKLFDIGISTRRALMLYKSGAVIATDAGLKTENSNGNGSLMRMLPIAYYLSSSDYSDDEEVEIINKFSSLTHGHPISMLGCKIFSDYLKEILSGADKKEAYMNICENDYSKWYSDETLEKYSRLLSGDIGNIQEKDISSSGYVVSTLEASLWCSLNYDNYRDAVITAVNLGNDTDTVAAITGGINGIVYGVDSIPTEWLSVLRKSSYLDELCDSYTDTINSSISHTGYGYLANDPDACVLGPKIELDDMFSQESNNNESNSVVKKK